MSAIAFTLRGGSVTQRPPVRFGPRLGQLLVTRVPSAGPAAELASVDATEQAPSESPGNLISIETPGVLASTSRGVVPHLSRDHVLDTRAIRGVHVSYESFLEVQQPLPPLYPSTFPMSDFLGFSSSQHLLSLSIRNPGHLRVTPPNQAQAVQVWSHRGVRKVAPATWHDQALACKPDLLEAISDAPYTSPPFSQKRLTKALERSALWLLGLLRREPTPRNVLVQMQGAASHPARTAWAHTLREPADELQGESMEGRAFGFAFDLAHLRNAVAAESAATSADGIVPFLQTSLKQLRVDKLRVARTPLSPHEILFLVRDIGIDLFDTHWAQDAAQYGVALDFTFPAPVDGHVSGSIENTSATTQPLARDARVARRRDHGLYDLGFNLYDAVYAHDHTPLAATYSSCSCLACAPVAPTNHLAHSTLSDVLTPTTPLASYKRSYIHHLLQTHEMSAHALLTMHNLTVLDAFFAGVRNAIQIDLARSDGANSGDQYSGFAAEVERFIAYYDGSLRVLEEAKTDWKEVDLARGKGRLAREKEAAEMEVAAAAAVAEA